MEKDKPTSSLYARRSIILTTKHAKAIAIAPPFLDKLNASVLEYVVDTDKLGTFSGEIKRETDALSCVRKKCHWAIDELGDKVKFALANEGSFGPHPVIPFMPCDHEILYFIDREQDFHLHLSYRTEKTNYAMETIDSLEALQQFAEKTLFPSHALIVRPYGCEVAELLFKGLNTQSALEAAFKQCQQATPDKKVWVETDMRAQFNPMRMLAIGELAAALAQRLATHCPECRMPGWGRSRQEKGLTCRWCGMPTELVKSEIFTCVKCSYEEALERSDGLKQAEPQYCPYCNP